MTTEEENAFQIARYLQQQDSRTLFLLAIHLVTKSRMKMNGVRELTERLKLKR